MALTHLTKNDFDQAVNAGDDLVVVDFFATWCGPCKMLAPVIDSIGGKYGDKAVIAKVDVDANPGLAAKYGVMSIPTVIFFKDGKEIDRKVGVQPAGVYTKLLDDNL